VLIAAVAFGAGLAVSGDEPAPAPAPPGPEGLSEVRCDRVHTAGGGVEAFVSGLEAGETGCLRAGVHPIEGVATIEAPGVVLTSYPGETATLAGRLWIKRGADGVRVEDLVLEGRNPQGRPSPTVNANDVVFRGNDVSNEHTAICFVIGDDQYGDADGTVIEGNRVHDCGRLPPTNRDHGIYVAHASNTMIRDNLIYDNADRGVQLYPDATGTVVTGNVIDGNGEGIIFGGDQDEASSDNVVEGNLITGSTVRFNVESHWQGPVGTGNVVRGNCVWTSRSDYPGDPAGSGIEPAIDGVRAADNIVADPGYADQPAGDFGLGDDSPCASTAAVP